MRLYVGPAASSTGWVFEYALTDPALVSSLLDLRRFQDDVLRPALAAIPGVAEVATVGGELREVRVDVKPRQLRERGLAFTDVRRALRAALVAARRTAHHPGLARRSRSAAGAAPRRGSRCASATSRWCA